MFDEEKAGKVLQQMRDGATLTTVCQMPGMPSRAEVYGWLRDGTAKIGRKTFRTAYAEAEEDRRMTWRDLAVLSITKFEGSGDRDEDKWRLSLAQKKSQVLMQMSKESGVEILTKGDSATPLVVIRKFLPGDAE